MANVARDIIWPTDKNILVRVVFLYVGQGDATIVLVKDGDGYKCLLVDINLDEQNGGIDVPRLMKDLLEDEQGKLGAFVNTHPHNDHLGGVIELSNAVDIQEVWHSGHKPGKKHRDSYDNLQKFIKKVKKEHGDASEIELQGSREAKTVGEAKYYVLAPAEYVKDDIDGEDGEARYRRIHEQCAVLKFGKDSTWTILVGDADRDAFEKHITKYHKERLPAQILGVSHHGSRTFFRYCESDDPYKEGLRAINPDYAIISAPKRKESSHGHPHQDAVKFYEEEVGKDNVLHTGADRWCFIGDIFSDGKYQVTDDGGELAEEYQLGKCKEEEQKKKAQKAAVVAASPVVSRTRIDKRPMGSQ